MSAKKEPIPGGLSLIEIEQVRAHVSTVWQQITSNLPSSQDVQSLKSLGLWEHYLVERGREATAALAKVPFRLRQELIPRSFDFRDDYSALEQLNVKLAALCNEHTQDILVQLRQGKLLRALLAELAKHEMSRKRLPVQFFAARLWLGSIAGEKLIDNTAQAAASKIWPVVRPHLPDWAMVECAQAANGRPGHLLRVAVGTPPAQFRGVLAEAR